MYRPTTIPRIPVPKNITIRILSRNGLTYFIDVLFTISQYYNLIGYTHKIREYLILKI